MLKVPFRFCVRYEKSSCHKTFQTCTWYKTLFETINTHLDDDKKCVGLHSAEVYMGGYIQTVVFVIAMVVADLDFNTPDPQLDANLTFFLSESKNYN